MHRQYLNMAWEQRENRHPSVPLGIVARGRREYPVTGLRPSVIIRRKKGKDKGYLAHSEKQEK